MKMKIKTRTQIQTQQKMQMQTEQQMQMHLVYLDGKPSIFTFDCAYEKQDTKLINVIDLLCELSDTDTEYNMIYYISNKTRFDNVSKIPIVILLEFIDDYSGNVPNEYIETFKNKIQTNYGYIYVLQILYSQKPVSYWDKYLCV